MFQQRCGAAGDAGRYAASIEVTNMISPSYNFKEFLDAMIGKDYVEIVVAANQECDAAERRSYSVRGAPRAREMGSTQYAASLKAFIFFMQSGIQPSSADNWEFAMYRPICEALVEKKQFKPTVLEMFK